MPDKFHYTYQMMLDDLSYIAKSLESANWVPDLIIGPARGGLVPAVYLSHYFNVKMEPINLSLRDFKTDLAKVKFDITNILEYKKILVIDDIVDSGETFFQLNNLLNQHIRNINNGENDIQIKYAACFYNTTNNSQFNLDFYARPIDKTVNNLWIVFPFDEWFNPVK